MPYKFIISAYGSQISMNPGPLFYSLRTFNLLVEMTLEINMHFCTFYIMLDRQHIDSRKVFEEKTESEENVDKACLSVSEAIPVSEESVPVDEVSLRSSRAGEWSDIQATEARIADVREIAPETGGSLDIPVVTQPVDNGC